MHCPTIFVASRGGGGLHCRAVQGSARQCRAGQCSAEKSREVQASGSRNALAVAQVEQLRFEREVARQKEGHPKIHAAHK